jgi:hypothetical protein
VLGVVPGSNGIVGCKEEGTGNRMGVFGASCFGAFSISSLASSGSELKTILLLFGILVENIIPTSDISYTLFD